MFSHIYVTRNPCLVSCNAWKSHSPHPHSAVFHHPDSARLLSNTLPPASSLRAPAHPSARLHPATSTRARVNVASAGQSAPDSQSRTFCKHAHRRRASILIPDSTPFTTPNPVQPFKGAVRYIESSDPELGGWSVISG